MAGAGTGSSDEKAGLLLERPDNSRFADDGNFNDAWRNRYRDMNEPPFEQWLRNRNATR